MWQDSAAQFPPCIPATPDELLVLLSKRADRTLSPRGIELGGMFYTSDELMALRCELASHNVDADRVAVRYNPWDLGEVWVLNPIPMENTYLKASAVDPAMKGMTEYQWRVLKRAIDGRGFGGGRFRGLGRAEVAAGVVQEGRFGGLRIGESKGGSRCRRWQRLRLAGLRGSWTASAQRSN